jgi:hypothetical protein
LPPKNLKIAEKRVENIPKNIKKSENSSGIPLKSD